MLWDFLCGELIPLRKVSSVSALCSRRRRFRSAETWNYHPTLDVFFSFGFSQISSLVEQHGSVGSLRPSAVARVGQAVNVAVERFVTVGETIADDYPEVRQGMYEACKEARQAGKQLFFSVSEYCTTRRLALRFRSVKQAHKQKNRASRTLRRTLTKFRLLTSWSYCLTDRKRSKLETWLVT